MNSNESTVDPEMPLASSSSSPSPFMGDNCVNTMGMLEAIWRDVNTVTVTSTTITKEGDNGQQPSTSKTLETLTQSTATTAENAHGETMAPKAVGVDDVEMDEIAGGDAPTVMVVVGKPVTDAPAVVVAPVDEAVMEMAAAADVDVELAKAKGEKRKRHRRHTGSKYEIMTNDWPPCLDDHYDYIVCRQWRFVKRRFLRASAPNKYPTIIKRIAIVKCTSTTSRYDYGVMFGKWKLAEIGFDAHYRLQSAPRTLINVLYVPPIVEFQKRLAADKAYKHTSAYAVRHVLGDIEHWTNWNWNSNTQQFKVGQYKNATYGSFRMRWSTLRYFCNEMWYDISFFLPIAPSTRHYVKQQQDSNELSDSDYDVREIEALDTADEYEAEDEDDEDEEEEGDAPFDMDDDLVDVFGDDSDSDLPGTPVVLATPPPPMTPPLAQQQSPTSGNQQVHEQ